MASLFTVRSITILALGLIVGGLLGMGYWHINPIDAKFQAGWPPLRVAGITDSHSAAYRSTVLVDVAGVGTTYTDQKEMQRLGEYYASKLGSYRFLVFLGERLKEQAPEYFDILDERAGELTVTDELIEMMTTKYWYDADATVEVRVDSRDASEAVLIAGIIHQTFPTYLLIEDRDKWWSEYEQTLAEFNKVNAELAEVRSELNSVELAVGVTDRDPAYIVADAKVGALSSELDGLTRDLASSIAEGATGGEYEDILEQLDRVSIALAEARSEMASLEARAEADRRELNLDYAAASAKVGALDGQISILARALVSLATEEPEQLEAFSLLTIGEPTNPVTLPRDRLRGRNALMMGAVLGLGGAWVGLNYRGLVKGLSPSREDTAEPEEDEEA